jgi:MFS family permease
LITGAALLTLGCVQAGFAVMQSTLVYTAAPEPRRAEAMGLMTMCIGVSPLGFMAVGALAEHLGASMAILICALGGLIGVALTWPLCRACLREQALSRAPSARSVRLPGGVTEAGRYQPKGLASVSGRA